MIKESLKKNKLAINIYYTYKKMLEKCRYIRQYTLFKDALSKKRGFVIKNTDKVMILGENTEETYFDTHYIYHPAWAARIVTKINPEYHVDISSILSFSSILSAYIPIHFYDYRPANIHLSNLTSKKENLQNLSFENNSVHSLSCMHTVEHIGLGRYGDEIDPDADLKAISELQRVLAVGGSLLFVVPIGGTPRICFNAHRIYSYAQIIKYFDQLTLKEFTLIPDNATTVGMIQNATEENANAQKYGCGCFWFMKK